MLTNLQLFCFFPVIGFMNPLSDNDSSLETKFVITKSCSFSLCRNSLRRWPSEGRSEGDSRDNKYHRCSLQCRKPEETINIFSSFKISTTLIIISNKYQTPLTFNKIVGLELFIYTINLKYFLWLVI